MPLMYLPLSALYISSVPVLMSIGLIGLEKSTFGAKLVPILVSLFAKSAAGVVLRRIRAAAGGEGERTRRQRRCLPYRPEARPRSRCKWCSPPAAWWA